MGEEPLAGTAMSGVRYIFISWPKTWWAKKQYESRNFPQSLAQYLQALQKEKKVFTRLVHRYDKVSEEQSQLFIMPDGVKYADVQIGDIENVFRRFFDGLSDEDYDRQEAKGNYMFCCTHGKRDKCCAKFGQPIIKEIERISKDKSFDIEVWECTHIGADRFAATAVVFPHGYMYGRLRSDDCESVVNHLIQGYPYVPCFRGQLGLGSVEQTAQAFGHWYLFEHKIDNAEVTIDDLSQTTNEDYKAIVSVKDKLSKKQYASHSLLLQKKDFSTYMDCDGVKAGSIKKVSRWVVAKSQLLD
jgi:hypothetical protein